ncbi:MAG: peptidylprolyl isomerase [Desulfosarcinaceae bacterium]|nr:peptidylprolyl isomerase [Desulfosarcinaceae bacterium]
MKIRQYGPMLVALALTLAATASLARAEDAKPAPEGVKVATVNGVAITQSAFDRELNLFQRRIRRSLDSLTSDQMAQVQDSILNDLINRELLFQESGKQKIEVPDEMVQKEFDRIKGRYQDPKQFQTVMEQMQMTEAGLKEQIHRKTAVQKLINQEVGDKIELTEAEAKTVYEQNPDDFKQMAQVRARHILVKVAADADEATKSSAREKLAAVQTQAQQGADFAELAKTHSEGPSNVRGGDLGFFGRGQMVKPFEEAAFALEPGKISDIVETRFGYHLIKVEEKKAEQALSFEEVKGKLMEKLKRSKIEQQMMTYLLSLRKAAKIETFMPKADAASE